MDGLAAETVTIDILINSHNNTDSGMNSARQSIDRVEQAAQSARRELDRLGGTHASPKVGIVDKASSTLSKIDRGLSSIAGKTVRAGVRIIDYATRPLRAIKNALFSIKGLVMAIGAGWAANKLISGPLALADAYSSAKIGFSNLLGEAGAQDMMDKLDKFAKETPFKTSGVIANAQKMMAMGWNPEDIIKDMNTIGNAAAATGKMDQGLESIVRALSQIKTKGKLSTEELNQLAEAGIAAKSMLAEQLGYGTGDSGIAAMTKDLEGGLIGSEIAIQALLKGMEQFDGTMQKTANETVDGLKSQISDAFEINIFRRWGQGLQDGAKRGFGKIVELLDKSEGSLAKFGDTVYEIGKQLSNWAADKLENTIDKILEITNRDDFKDASIGGKIKILWDEVIAQPFGEWWDSKGKPYMIKKMNSIGEGLGSGLSKGLLALLGINDTGALEEATTIGASFASGFAKGFEGKKVWDAIIKAAGRSFNVGIKAIFSNGWIATFISTALAVKVSAGILKGISAVQHAWYGEGPVGGLFGTSGIGYAGGGIKGFLGGASTASGVLEGSGLIGLLAKLGKVSTGHGSILFNGTKLGTLVGSTAQSGAGLALAGAGTAAGVIGGVAGLGNSIVDLTRTIKADSKNDKKLYGTRSATKAGMVGIGAGIGTLIAPGIGTAIGAGLGGLATFVAGNKLADAISGVSKSTKELNEEATELANINMAKRFGEATLSAEQLEKRIKSTFGDGTLNRVNKFNQSMKDLETISNSTANYKDDLDYTHERITAKEELSDSDIEAYRNSLVGYADALSQLIAGKKESSLSAFKLLYGNDAKGLQKATEGINRTYTKLENDLKDKTEKLNEVISDAFADGKIDLDEEKKIDEIIQQIDQIYDKVEKHIQEKEKAKNEASMDLLGMKYSDENLTPESFKSLLSELDAQSETNMKAYDDAYIEAKAELDLEYTGTRRLSDDYKNALAEIQKKWREGKKITVMQKVDVAFDVLDVKYEDELAGIQKKIESNELFSTTDLATLRDSTSKKKFYRNTGVTTYTANWNDNSAMEFEAMRDSWLESAGIDAATQIEMQSIYDSLKSYEQDLMSLKADYEAAGKEVPEEISNALEKISNIKLMTGDMDSFYDVVGEQLAKDNPAYAKAMLDAKEAGQEIPQALIDGINKGLNVETIEVGTNLKLTADKKDIDTSALDKTTKDVVEKLQDEGIIFTKDGEVKIETKDGKIDTTGLDEATANKVRELEKEGAIKVNKDGTVSITASKVETEKLKEETDKALEYLENTGYFEVDKKGNVKLGVEEIDYDDVDFRTQEALDKLEESGVIEIDKNGIVTIKASVNTDSAKEKTESETNNALGGTQNVDKTANVNVDSNTTGEEAAAQKSYGEVKGATDTAFSVSIQENGKVSVLSLSVSSDSAISSAWSKLKANVTNTFNKSIWVSPQIKYRIGTPPTSKDDANDPKKANGGYVDKAIRTIVGEAGPEMIIPLSANRRTRGKYLWERAGRAMGLYNSSGDEKVYMNANGGLYGAGASKIDEMMNRSAFGNTSGASRIGEMITRANSGNETESVQRSGRNNTVKVDVGGITISINSSGNGVKEDIMQNMDAIQAQIAKVLEDAFQNMPLTVGT